jgi:hypothetical protein
MILAKTPTLIYSITMQSMIKSDHHGIDNYDKSSTVLRLFGVPDSLAISRLEITRRRRG